MRNCTALMTTANEVRKHRRDIVGDQSTLIFTDGHGRVAPYSSVFSELFQAEIIRVCLPDVQTVLNVCRNERRSVLTRENRSISDTASELNSTLNARAKTECD